MPPRQRFLKRPPLALVDSGELNPRDFVASTAVTRLNGYAGGNGNRNQLSREIDLLGLSANGKKRLADLVGR
jgi:hypothetical protein